MESILVTGTSSGIGRSTALRLARRGNVVYAGVRRGEDGDALVRDGGANVRPIVLDVTDAASIAAARATIEADAGAPLRGLVNNAGASLAGPLELLPPEALRAHFELNFYAPLALVQTLAPLLRRTRGRVVNVSSIQGRFVAPFLGPYAASKHALEAASDALRVELHPFGIAVSLIEPGAVKTPIWRVSGGRSDAALADADPALRALYAEALEATRALAARIAARAIEPERVAVAIERALFVKRPRSRYLVGNDARVRLAIARLPDRLRDRLFLRLLKRIKANPPGVS